MSVAAARAPERAAQRATVRAAEEEAASPALDRGLAVGWLALLPLVAAYELASAIAPTGPRNAAEYLITAPLAALSPSGEIARWVVEIAATAVAVAAVLRADLGLARRCLRIALEGLLGAALLGPLLLALLPLLGAEAPALDGPSGVVGPSSAALLAGGAAFEEVVFRAGLLFVLLWLARATWLWLLGSQRAATGLGAATALLGSALLFAAAHLAPVVGLLAPGGEPFDGPRFAWRFVAGLALALVFRWRGMGVAAWTHAFFNLALVLGAGPEVFL